MRAALVLSLALTAALSLGACSKSAQPQVHEANADLKAAGESTQNAAEHLGEAASRDATSASDSAKSGAANARNATGDALEKAGADMKTHPQK